MIYRLYLFIAIFAGVSIAQAAPTVEKTIAKARAYIGEESKLKEINSMRFTGTFKPAGTDQTGTIEIILERPYSQLKTVEFNGVIEITGNGEYEGWRKRINAARPDEWAVEVLTVSQIKRARINTWENMNFFLDSRILQTEITDQGIRKVDGKDAHVLRYQYPTGFYYLRFIDMETGKLVRTENGDGLAIVEGGEKIYDGFRMPEVLVSYDQEGNVVNTVTFDTIEFNIEVEDGIFDMPSFIDR